MILCRSALNAGMHAGIRSVQITIVYRATVDSLPSSGKAKLKELSLTHGHSVVAADTAAALAMSIAVSQTGLTNLLMLTCHVLLHGLSTAMPPRTGLRAWNQTPACSALYCASSWQKMVKTSLQQQAASPENSDSDSWVERCRGTLLLLPAAW
jgi:hypothetical protein